MAKAALGPPRQRQTCPLEGGTNRHLQFQPVIKVDLQTLFGNQLDGGSLAVAFHALAGEGVRIPRERVIRNWIADFPPEIRPKLRTEVSSPDGLLTRVIFVAFQPSVVDDRGEVVG